MEKLKFFNWENEKIFKIKLPNTEKLKRIAN